MLFLYLKAKGVKMRMILGEERTVEKRFLKQMVQFVIFIGIISIPCFLIMHYANQLITKKIRANNANFLYTTSLSLDSELSGAYAKVDSLVEQNLADYHTLLNKEKAAPADTTVALYHLYDEFKNSQLDNYFFENTFLYFPMSKLIMTSEGTYDEDVYFKKKMIFHQYPENYFGQLVKQSFYNIFCPATEILTQGKDGNFFVSQQSVIPVAIKPSEALSGNGIAVVLINEEKLNSFFERLSIDRSSFIYLQNTQTGEILNSPSDDKYEDLLQLSDQNYKAKNQVFELQKKGESYQISWKNSAVSKLRYICVEPELLITKQIESFTYRTFLITAIAVAIFSLIIGGYSKYMNRNIKAMMGRLSEASGMTADTSEKQQINLPSLKQAIEVLCAQHENSRPYLVYSLLERTLCNTITEEEQNHFKSEFSEFEDGRFFQIYIWKFQNMEKEKWDWIRERLEAYGYVLFMQSEQAMLVYLTAESEDQMKEKQEQIRLDEERCSRREVQYICARGEVFTSISENYRNYHQVLNVIQYYAVGQKKTIYGMEDVLCVSDEAIAQEDKGQLKNMLKTNPIEASRQVANLIVTMKQKNISMDQFRINIKELVLVLQEALYEQRIPISSVFETESKGFFEQIDQALTPEKLEQLCLSLYQKVPDQGSQKEAVSQAEQTLLAYIDQNLSEISLNMLSEAVGMNQNYLSQYFKKHFGISFIDYVTNKKIEKAKELLVSTDDTCKAIGEMLGYGAQNTFIRVFKKAESMTPAEYRQRNKK